MTKNRLLPTALMMTVSLYMLTLTAAASTPAAGVVATQQSPLSVRATAAASGNRVGTLPKGANVRLIKRSGDWWQVQYAQNRLGWANSDYIEPLTKSYTARVQTQSGALNVRSGASNAYSIITTVPKGSYLSVLSSAGGWSKVVFDGTRTGYVNSGYLEGSPPATGGGSYQEKEIRLSVPDYKQYDARWANIKIGTAGENMRQIGCTTTALADTESHRTGRAVTPADISRQVGYTAGGALYWPDRYEKYSNGDYLGEIKRQLKNGKPVIVGAKKSNGSAHWVVVMGHNGNSGLRSADFYIHDPGGQRKTLGDLFSEYPLFHKLKYYD